MTNKRIWKTGGLAVVATIAFAAFAFRAAEWTKGLNSEFVVLGQTGGPTGGGTTTGSGTNTATQITKIVPQIVAGNVGTAKYTTTIEIVNPNSGPLTVSGNFYKQDGSAVSLAFTSNLTAASVTNGVLNSFTLGANQVLVLTSSSTSTATLAWGRIVSSGTANVATFFDVRDISTNVLFSRVGVNASGSDMASFVVPRIRNVAAGLDVGFALVNTGSSTANLTATLKDAAGITIDAETISMAPLSHRALYTRELFGLTNEPDGTNYHYVIFESSSPTFAAMSLATEGSALTSFPVDRLR
jgi:hypothetical protein